MIATQLLSIKRIVQLLVILPVLMVILVGSFLFRSELDYPVIDDETKQNLQLSVL